MKLPFRCLGFSFGFDSECETDLPCELGGKWAWNFYKCTTERPFVDSRPSLGYSHDIRRGLFKRQHFLKRWLVRRGKQVLQFLGRRYIIHPRVLCHCVYTSVTFILTGKTCIRNKYWCLFLKLRICVGECRGIGDYPSHFQVDFIEMTSKTEAVESLGACKKMSVLVILFAYQLVLFSSSHAMVYPTHTHSVALSHQKQSETMNTKWWAPNDLSCGISNACDQRWWTVMSEELTTGSFASSAWQRIHRWKSSQDCSGFFFERP